jgi:hypothetical protein
MGLKLNDYRQIIGGIREEKMVAGYVEMEKQLKTFVGKTITEIEFFQDKKDDELKIRLKVDKSELIVFVKFAAIYDVCENAELAGERGEGL